MTRGSHSHARCAQPLLFAEQVAAWLAYRGGDSTMDIASRLHRSPRQVRAILHGAD